MQDLGSCVIYVAVGLLVYLLAYGPVDWSDAWVYVISGLWPAFLIWWALPYVLAAIATVVAVVILVSVSLWAWKDFRS